MVFISKQAYYDLEVIFVGLLKWKKHELSIKFADEYIDKIIEHCYNLDTISYHSKASLPSHTRHGSNIYRYRYNKQTTWYIVYDMDGFGNFYVNKIISNHIST
jgi:hypothetical protein